MVRWKYRKPDKTDLYQCFLIYTHHKWELGRYTPLSLSNLDMKEPIEMLRSFAPILLPGLLLALFLGQASVASAVDGEKLYLQHCAACHGDTGDGGVGVPLSLPDFQSSVSNEYLKISIKQGRPGRVMPAFPQLSEAELDSIVKHLRTFADVAIPDEDPTPVKGDPVKGKQLYTKYCLSCHGPNGEGSKGTGVTFSRPRDLPILAPALNNPGFQVAATDKMIKHALSRGRRGTPMPSFLKSGMTVQDLNDIVRYIRSFTPDKASNTGDTASPTIVVDSPYSLKETVENIKRAIIGKNFRLIRVQTLDDGMVAKDKQDEKQTIVYFCNFELLNRALGIDPRVGLFLPCRITVVEHNGKVQMMAINPLRLSKLFNNNELDKACLEMHDLYTEILEEASL